MVELGKFSIFLALALSAWGAVAALVGARRKRESLVRSGEGAIWAAAAAMTVAAAMLFQAFLSRNFSVEYVASYSSRSLSTFYTVGAFWAGQAGSLLLWGWVLSLYAGVVVWQNRRRNRNLMPYVVGVLAAVIFLLAFLVAFLSNPFKTLEFTPVDGMGLNPMLQNPGQLFHPVALYLGYVGFAIPFAFAIAALATGNLGDVWIRTVRRWTVVTWIFLTAGIIFGMRWAYVELGWGGYWAWDPVENASLLPWLTGTAYLHSVMIQERKGMLKVWNVSLVVATFALSLFGTFLTRSGVISSVHAFAESNIGPFLLGSIVLTVLVSGTLIVWRLPELRGKVTMESVVSRESSFLLNNLLFVAITFAVFWGTVFPLLAQAVRGVQVSVGPPFFQTVVSPIAILLLALTGFCPLLAWRKASLKNLRRNFIAPLATSLVAFAAVLWLTGGRHIAAVAVLTFSAFVTATIVIEFYRGAKVRRRLSGAGWGSAVVRLVRKNPRRYGGYIVHLGVVMLLVGISLHVAYKKEHSVTLRVGQSSSIGGYTFTLDKLEDIGTAAKIGFVARLSLKDSSSGKSLGRLSTEKAVYANQDQPTTEVGIRSTPVEDLYIIPETGDPTDGVISFRVLVNPAVFWIWAGGIVVLFGGALAAWPERKAKREPDFAKEVSDVPPVPERVTV